MNHFVGLTNKEVEERIQLGQVNKSDNNISKTKKQIVREHTLTYFNFLNLFLAGLIIISGKYLNMTFMGVVISNALIGIIQEFRVKKMIDSISIVTVSKVKVIRDSRETVIPVEELVLDDIVFVEAGNQIGTDCIVLESSSLELNESLLTGESEAVKKEINDELLAGSFVISGTGYAKVIRVGSDNYSSSIINKARIHRPAVSEMRDSIEKVIKVISIAIIPVGLLLFYSQYNANPDLSNAIVKTVGGVVGMIPEGLVLLTSLSFVLGVGRLARKQALVQQMEAIEALSRVDVLCLDKTGTITTGDLSVTDIISYNNDLKEDIHTIMSALVHSSTDTNVTQEALRAYFNSSYSYSMVEEVPFSSERKYRAMRFDNGHQYILGAPEFLTEEEDILKKTEYYSSEGLRVLYLAEVSDMHTLENKQSVALIVLKDVIKEDAKDTLQYFADHHVNIKILSGDNPMTVSKTCKLVGLQDANKYVDASTLPDSIEELSQVIDNYNVFGRVKPEQKELLVKAFQNNDHIVSMVGDGVNDVLAIKRADCGIAMANGADAAKQAAHIVLMDSNFSSMKNIVREGRTIIANIERVSSLYLTKTIYSALLSFLFGLLGRPYPFIPFQLTIISALAIGTPSFFITLEKDVDVHSEGFLKHILHTALPCGLAIVCYAIGLVIAQSFLHFDALTYTTCIYLVTAFISFLVLYKVCQPLNLYRGLLVGVTSVICFLIILIFPNLLEIQPILSKQFLAIIPLCLVAILLVYVLTVIIDKLPIDKYLRRR